MLPERLYHLRLFHFIYKEKSEVSKIKSNIENLTRMTYESSNLEIFILALALYCSCGDKMFLKNTFKSLVSKGATTWWLKRA